MPRYYWLRTKRFLARKVLHTDDTPHAIALGTACAVFVAFLPLMGIQTLLAIALAALLRANKAVCIPAVWVTNPFTFGPIYTLCLFVGRLVIPGGADDMGTTLATLKELRAQSMWTSTFWNDLLHFIAGLGAELWVGCLVTGLGAGFIAYGLARWGVAAYRERRRQKLLRRSLFRTRSDRAPASPLTDPA